MAEVEIPVIDLKNVFDVLDEDDDGGSLNVENLDAENMDLWIYMVQYSMFVGSSADIGYVFSR